MELFALRYPNGSVQLGTPTSVNNFLYTSEWLQGPYAAMANGDSHLCLLRESGFIECRAATAPVAGFDSSSGVLMQHRSDVRFSQIAAANCFTCALRVNDSKVECFGDVASDWLVAPLPPVRMALNSSSLQYSVIAAQYAGGWCGLILDQAGRDLYCWSVNNSIETLALPAPTAPLFWRAPMWSSEQTRGCAIRNDGCFACNWTDGSIGLPDPSQQTAVSDLTSWRAVLSGAVASTGTVMDYLNVGTTDYPLDFQFSPVRFIGVDSTHGDDSRCMAVNTLSPADLLAFIPCATLAGAMQQLTRRNTWIHFLPGTHFGGGETINFVDVTLSSQPPPFMTASELASIGNGSWTQRMTDASALNPAAVLDCSGFVHCVSCDFRRFSLIGLSFTGSIEHAITHYFPFVSEDTVEPDFTMLNCNFTRVGGMLYKRLGQALISGCSMSDCTQNTNVTALVDLQQVDGSISSSSFERNYFLDSDPADLSLRTCVRIENSNKARAVGISDCSFIDNHASAPFAAAVPPPSVLGGVAIQIYAFKLQIGIDRCTFINQTTAGTSVYGGRGDSHFAAE